MNFLLYCLLKLFGTKIVVLDKLGNSAKIELTEIDGNKLLIYTDL